jgi:hypothetical protein
MKMRNFSADLSLLSGPCARRFKLSGSDATSPAAALRLASSNSPSHRVTRRPPSGRDETELGGRYGKDREDLAGLLVDMLGDSCAHRSVPPDSARLRLSVSEILPGQSEPACCAMRQAIPGRIFPGSIDCLRPLRKNCQSKRLSDRVPGPIVHTDRGSEHGWPFAQILQRIPGICLPAPLASRWNWPPLDTKPQGSRTIARTAHLDAKIEHSHLVKDSLTNQVDPLQVEYESSIEGAPPQGLIPRGYVGSNGFPDPPDLLA